MKLTSLKEHVSQKLKRAGLLTSILVTAGFIQQSKAQVNPLSGIYFNNRYQVNPAMAGIDQGLTLNLGLRQQWNSIAGSPRTQTLTGEYGFNEKTGVGINAYNDKTGMFTKTKVMATYGYHLPVNADGTKLSFGLSLGFMDQHLDASGLNGTTGDAAVAQYNDQKPYFDTEFGMAYLSKNLTLQAALPNMKTLFNKDENTAGGDESSFYASASYKFQLSNFLDGSGLEPLVAMRGIRGGDNIIDAGANLTVAGNAANVMAIYHSTKSATFGLGVNYKSLLTISGMYTTETSALRSFASGNFELNLKVNLFGK